MPRINDDGRLTADQIVLSCFRLFQEILEYILAQTRAASEEVDLSRVFEAGLGEMGYHADHSDWEDLSQEEQAAWIRVVDTVGKQIEGAVDLSWQELAKSAFLHHQICLQKTHADFTHLPPTLQLLWETIARHLANLLVFDITEDGAISTHEQRIMDWFEVKFEERVGPALQVLSKERL